MGITKNMSKKDEVGKLKADLSAEAQKAKAEIERLKRELKKRKKYGLVWEEKPEEVVEMCKEKLPVLKEVKNKDLIRMRYYSAQKWSLTHYDCPECKNTYLA